MNGSVSGCTFSMCNVEYGLIKVNDNFNAHPEGLKMLQGFENIDSQKLFSITHCSFEISNNHSLVYVIEEQTSRDDADDFVSEKNRNIRIKPDQFSNELKKEFNEKFIKFHANSQSDNAITNEIKMKKSFPSKLLMTLSSFLLVVIITTIIIIKKRVQSINEPESEMNSIDSNIA